MVHRGFPIYCLFLATLNFVRTRCRRPERAQCEKGKITLFPRLLANPIRIFFFAYLVVRSEESFAIVPVFTVLGVSLPPIRKLSFYFFFLTLSVSMSAAFSTLVKARGGSEGGCRRMIGQRTDWKDLFG